MKRNNLIIVFLMVISSFLFLSCEKEDENMRQELAGWLYTTDLTGNNLKKVYSFGDDVLIVSKFNNFSGKKVTKISLSYSVIDEQGNPGPAELVNTYSGNDIEFISEEQQYKIQMSFAIDNQTIIDKNLQLTIKLETSEGESQEKIIAKFQVIESFEYLISGVKYYYMYSNTYTDAGMNYSVENSANYTALTTVMNHHGFNPENANFIGELGGILSNHTPDWVAEYYVSIWPQWLAQTVEEMHLTYGYESDYYGGPKSLKSTEFGTYAQIDEAIEAGKMVIVHGNFRGDVSFNHQIVLLAKNDISFLAHDPAGKWDGNIDGTYTNIATAGEYVKYSKESVYAAIGTSGSVWMHISVDPAEESLDITTTKSGIIKMTR